MQWSKIVLIYFAFLIATILFAVIFNEVLGLPSEISVAQLGPGVVALLAVYLLKDRLPSFPSDPDSPPLSAYLVTVLLPLVPAIVVIVVALIVGDLDNLPIPSNLGVLLWIPIGALGEELGWRSYLQRKLLPLISPTSGFVVLGVLWTLWHVGNFQYGVLFMLGQLFLLVGISLVLGGISLRYGNNLWLATVSHIAINLAILIVFDALDSDSLILVSPGYMLAYGLLGFIPSIIYYRVLIAGLHTE